MSLFDKPKYSPKESVVLLSVVRRSEFDHDYNAPSPQTGHRYDISSQLKRAYIDDTKSPPQHLSTWDNISVSMSVASGSILSHNIHDDADETSSISSYDSHIVSGSGLSSLSSGGLSHTNHFQQNTQHVEQRTQSQPAQPPNTIPLSHDLAGDNRGQTLTNTRSDPTPVNEVDVFGFEKGVYLTDYDKHVTSRIAPEVQYSRESKWREMLINWTRWETHYHHLRQRCRKSIPVCVRGEAWQYLVRSRLAVDRRIARNQDREQSIKSVAVLNKSTTISSSSIVINNSHFYQPTRATYPTISPIHIQMEEDVVNKKFEKIYEEYVKTIGNSDNEKQIAMDIDREFQDHYLLKKGGTRHQAFFNLLKAYSIRTGQTYTQGQTCLAGVLLMFLVELDAFWTFTEICESEQYLANIYSDNLVKVQLWIKVLLALVKKRNATAYRYLHSSEIIPTGFILPWFMSCYIRQIKWFPTMLNLLDIFFCEGKKVLFKVGVYLICTLYGSREAQKKYDSAGDLQALREIPQHLFEDRNFIKQVCNVNITDDELMREMARQTKYMEQKQRDK